MNWEGKAAIKSLKMEDFIISQDSISNTYTELNEGEMELIKEDIRDVLIVLGILHVLKKKWFQLWTFQLPRKIFKISIGMFIFITRV